MYALCALDNVLNTHTYTDALQSIPNLNINKLQRFIIIIIMIFF